MTKARNVAVAAAVVCSWVTAQAAGAATVTEDIVGVISGANTTDTAGLFGTAGANLSGKAVTIHTQYVTTPFNSSGYCRTSRQCSHYESQGVAGTSGSITNSVTLNGRTLTYAPTYIGQIILDNNNAHNFAAYTDVYSGFGEGRRGSALSVAFTSALAFGAALSPGNQPVLHKNTDYLSFFDASSTLPIEQLNFSIDSASQ